MLPLKKLSALIGNPIFILRSAGQITLSNTITVDYGIAVKSKNSYLRNLSFTKVELLIFFIFSYH